MEVAVIIIGIILLILVFAGILIPLIPSIPLGLAALLLLHFSKIYHFPTTGLILFAAITVLVLLSDYYLPAWGAKKYGGSKYGMIGATIGSIIPLIFLSVSGFLVILFVFIGTYVGAYAAEYVFGGRDQAHRAAIGSVVGFIWTFFAKGIGMLFYSVVFVIAVLCYYKIGSYCGKILFS